MSLSDSRSAMTHVWVKVGQPERDVRVLARAWDRGPDQRQISA